MGSEITLSSAVRSNLLSLQNTANLLASTQEKLATGKKVNSALDDPTAFFTASSLNSRASDLSRLQDFVGNAVQTLKAADEGISAITNLVETAEATARQALQTATGTLNTATVTGSDPTITEVIAQVTGSGLVDHTDLVGGGNGIAEDETFTVTVGADVISVTIGTSGGSEVNTLDDLVTAINNHANNNSYVTASNVGNQLRLTADSADVDFTTGGTVDGASDFGITEQAYNSSNLIDLGVASSGETLTVKIGENTTKTITFGTSAGRVSTLAEFDTELDSTVGIDAGSSSVNTTNGTVTIAASTGGDAIEIGGTATLSNLGLTAGTTIPTTVTASADRTSFAAQFDDLRTQIDQLVQDAGFNGVNLLNGDSLTVTFNEDGTSTLGIAGVTYNSTGLGISASVNNFQHDNNVNAALTELSTATASLRSQASKFGSNLSVVEIRQDFTKSLINVLETGAANLTLADTNEEGANLLALQTRQQLSSTALSLASQADQNVLRLF